MTRRGRGPCHPRHWESDLLIGLERSAIGKLVERSTRYTKLVHLPQKQGYRQFAFISATARRTVRSEPSEPSGMSL